MKISLQPSVILAIAACCNIAAADSTGYTNFIRQIQVPSGLERDLPVAVTGERDSELVVDEKGSRFELWTVSSTPFVSYLLDTEYVGAYIPVANIQVTTADPYFKEGVYRTRADQPFTVKTTVSGLLSGDVPDAAKQVTYLHHKQQYGSGGPAANDPTKATLHSRDTYTQNKTYTDYRDISVIPGSDRLKVWGEERFSVYSLADGSAPASQIAAATVQVLPVSTGEIKGVTDNEMVRFQMPELVFNADDVYPKEGVFVQVYKKADESSKTRLPVGWTNSSYDGPMSVTLPSGGNDIAGAVDEDGEWVIELWAENPYFGNHLLDAVHFNFTGGIRVNSLVGSME